MRIKKTQTIAYEAGEYYLPLRGKALKLLGTEALYAFVPQVKDANLISKTSSFLTTYDLEHSFYYRIDVLLNSITIAHEIGVGELQEHDGNICLLRTQPLYVQLEGEERQVAYGSRPLCLLDYKNIMVSSYIPTNVVEALPDPHMIIVSTADHHPHPLKVEENSVVGRLNDTIESLNIADLPCVAPTYANVEEAPKIKGSIIYSDEWDCLKYYNGTVWKSI